VDRTTQYAKIADRFFHPNEAQLLAQLPAHKQAETFIRLWTLKEALLKACGRGLTGPLDRACFHLAGDRPATVSLDDPSLGEPSDWQFAELRLEDAGALSGPTAYQIAVAVRSRQPLRLSIRETLPLQWIADTHRAPAGGALWRIDLAQLRRRNECAS
jgi:4'-phosphopantetheinyl transferase